MVAAGLGDSDEAANDNEVLLRDTAIHEAGHAAMAVIDSNGKNIPEYSTIVAYRDSKGLVVDSCPTVLPEEMSLPMLTFGTIYASALQGARRKR